MKFNINEKVTPREPKDGDTRSIKKFAWLPTKCLRKEGLPTNVCNRYVYVWLEAYTENQKFRILDGLPIGVKRRWMEFSKVAIYQETWF